MVYTTLATLGAVLVIFYFMMRVGAMRGKSGVNAPAMTGDEMFEKANRVHMNTIEQFVLFIPMLWLGLHVVGDMYAGIAGAVWILGRLIYGQAYMKDPKSRSIGMLLTTLPLVYLIVTVGWDAISKAIM